MTYQFTAAPVRSLGGRVQDVRLAHVMLMRLGRATAGAISV